MRSQGLGRGTATGSCWSSLSMYGVLGMFMDAIGMLLLTLPLVQPLVMALGLRPDLVRHHRREDGGDLLDHPTDRTELFRCGWGADRTSRLWIDLQGYLVVLHL